MSPSSKFSSEIPHASGHTEMPLSERKAYTTSQYGVWEVLMMDEGQREQYLRLAHDVPKFFPSLYRLAQDIYSLSPHLFAVFLLCQVWSGCQEAIKMHFSGKLLRSVSGDQCPPAAQQNSNALIPRSSSA
jgi:hypothetical protein